MGGSVHRERSAHVSLQYGVVRATKLSTHLSEYASVLLFSPHFHPFLVEKSFLSKLDSHLFFFNNLERTFENNNRK